MLSVVIIGHAVIVCDGSFVSAFTVGVTRVFKRMVASCVGLFRSAVAADYPVLTVIRLVFRLVVVRRGSFVSAITVGVTDVIIRMIISCVRLFLVTVIADYPVLIVIGLVFRLVVVRRYSYVSAGTVRVAVIIVNVLGLIKILAAACTIVPVVRFVLGKLVRSIVLTAVYVSVRLITNGANCLFGTVSFAVLMILAGAFVDHTARALHKVACRIVSAGIVYVLMASVVTAVALGVIGVGIAMLCLIKILAAARTFVPVMSVT